MSNVKSSGVESNYLHNLKLAQFHNSLINERECQKNLPAVLLQEIITSGVDVNYRIPAESRILLQEENCQGYTYLHFAAHKKNLECVNLLLNNGADYTIQSSNGETPLHLVGKITWFHKENNAERTDQSSNLSIINSILSVQVKKGDTSNPTCKNGVSHFHIACAANNVEAVKFFLEAGVSVNLAISQSSSKFPGFTPLHFAVNSLCLETVELLLSHNADVYSKDAKNMSALHNLIESYRKIKDDANKSGTHPNLEDEKRKYAAMINMILNHGSKDFSNYFDNIDLTGYHIASTIEDSSLIKQLLKNNMNMNRSVRNDSPIWPGYTALHFAAHFDPAIVELLVQNGANILSRDANGITPLDLCLERYGPIQIHSILSAHNYFKDLLLSDESTRLMDLVFSMEHCHSLEEFLNNLSDVNVTIPSNSSLWPGFSLLHLAIIMSKSNKVYFDRIKLCLKKDISVSLKSTDGLTPIQLAIKLKDSALVEELLKYRKEEIEKNKVIQEDDLLNFQISCAIKDKEAFDQFIVNGIDVNGSVKSSFEWFELFKVSFIEIRVGWTPLHIAVYYREFEKVKVLLNHNADPNAQDVQGLTPIHLLMKHDIFRADRQNANLLLSKDLLNKVTCGSFSHLHVACFANKANAVEEYLKQGADINAIIRYEEFFKDQMKELSFLSEIEGFTLLQVAFKYNSFQAIETLLNHGAKVQVESSRGWFNVLSSMVSMYFSQKFVLAFRDTYMSKGVIDEDSNFTILHFACAIFNRDMVAESLKNGADVNARISSDSNRLWNGFTPLHVLMKRIVEVACSGEVLEDILKLLLENGANVMIGDAEGATPLHWAYHSYAVEGIIFGCDAIGLLLEKQSSYSINPADSHGFSHLHIASAMERPAIVEEFLKNGIDINQSVDPFQQFIGGHTALYFAIFQHAKEAIRVLLKYGADVKVENFEGNTPLHLVAKETFLDEAIVNDMVSMGADINAKNVRFESPFELLLKTKSMTEEHMKLFLNLGCRFNDFNSITLEGFIAIAINTSPYSIRTDLTKFIDIVGLPAMLSLDQNDCNAIHNIVSIYKPSIPPADYVKAIEKLVEIGCDINHRNNQGKTPLHVAADFQNVDGVKSLLRLGADANIVDLQGNTPFMDLRSYI